MLIMDGCSLASVAFQKPHDPPRCRGIGFYVWHAQTHGKQYASLLLPLPWGIRSSQLTSAVDPEMRAEFEKTSRSSPISGSARSAMSGGGPGNFDLAGWMAGTAPGPMGGAEPAAQAPATSGREGGGATRRRG